MPASREIPYGDKLEKLTVRIDPIEDKEIYFTDETPEFELVVSNGYDRPVVSREDIGIIWILGVGEGYPKPHTTEGVELDLGPGEVIRERIGGEYLAFEGTGVIGINQGFTLYGGADADKIIIKPQPTQSGGYRWLYTFTVWDKSHYESVHEQPKRLLKSSTQLTKYVLIAAATTAIVGLIQLIAIYGFI